MIQKNKGLSGSTLKWIAIIAMLIDHVAATILIRRILVYGYTEEWYNVYEVMRAIGRVAFPIFCFLLVEGVVYTHNVYRYLSRMTLFAVLTEIPFDLAFSGKIWYGEYQSVMLTLLIGLAAMLGCHLAEQKWKENYLLQYVVFGICLFIAMELAYLLKTDYAYKGVFSIMVFYFFRNERKLQLLAGAFTFIWEPWALAAFPLLMVYNGQRGRRMKYFFYAFYPLHLMVLYFICYLLGTHRVPVI